MFETHWNVEWAIAFASIFAGSYLGWMVAFEQWLDPLFRRCIGAMIGRTVVWVAAGPHFRVWGLAERPTSSTDATVAAVGSLTVLCSALLPLLALRIGTRVVTVDVILQASSYLVSFPMIAIFLFHVLRRRRDER